MDKVIIIAPEDLPIPPIRGGSVQIYLWNLHRMLMKNPTVDTTLICPGAAKAAGRPDGSRIVISKQLGTYRSQVLKCLRGKHPPIIQVENRPDIVPALKRALPASRIILNLHSTTFLGPQHISAARARHVLKSCDAVVLNSENLRDIFANRFQLTAGNWHAVVIHPGVNRSHYARPKNRVRHETAKPLKLLFVGRIIRQKGVHTLLGAVRRLVQANIPVHLTIVGRTPPWEMNYAQRVKTMARGLPVTWSGFVDPNRLPQYYWNADVFICPSQQTEAFGLVNVEAMAAGLAVIASRQGGIQEIVTPASGILIDDYRRSESFAKAIKTLYEDRELLTKLQAGAVERAKAFSWEKTAAQFANLYRELMGR